MDDDDYRHCAEIVVLFTFNDRNYNCNYDLRKEKIIRTVSAYFYTMFKYFS